MKCTLHGRRPASFATVLGKRNAGGADGYWCSMCSLKGAARLKPFASTLLRVRKREKFPAFLLIKLFAVERKEEEDENEVVEKVVCGEVESNSISLRTELGG